MVIFELPEGGGFKPFSDKDDNPIRVYLPLSTGRVLVGAYDPIAIDFERLQLGIVQCSLEHFIAAEDSPLLRTLSGQLGTRALLLTEAELDQIFCDALEEIFSTRSTS
jgi:hypothetical protein